MQNDNIFGSCSRHQWIWDKVSIIDSELILERKQCKKCNDFLLYFPLNSKCPKCGKIHSEQKVKRRLVMPVKEKNGIQFLCAECGTKRLEQLLNEGFKEEFKKKEKKIK